MIRALLPLLLFCTALRAELPAGNSITTGKDARVEHSLKAGGLARFGSNTQAQFQEDGTLQLRQGLCLVSSDSGWLRYSAVTVVTASGKITVRGTALIAVLADGSVKITCLDGKVKGDFASGQQVLEPGQMLLQTLKGTSAKAEVELATLIQTCVLLGDHFRPLPRASVIARHSEHQHKMVAKAIARQISSGPDRPISDQSNASGASNMVAVASAFPNSQVASNARASQITYSSGSSSDVISGSTLTLSSNAFLGRPSSSSGAILTSSASSVSLQLSRTGNQPIRVTTFVPVTAVSVFSGGSVWNLVDWSSAQSR